MKVTDCKVKLDLDAADVIEGMERVRRCALRAHQELERLNRAIEKNRELEAAQQNESDAAG